MRSSFVGTVSLSERFVGTLKLAIDAGFRQSFRQFRQFRQKNRIFFDLHLPKCIRVNRCEYIGMMFFVGTLKLAIDAGFRQSFRQFRQFRQKNGIPN